MVSAIIVAGGKGLRMGEDIKKQYLPLSGMPILSRSILPFETSPLINKIYLSIPRSDFEYCQQNVLDPFGFKTDIELVEGGEERQESVYNGLLKASGSMIVLIHDGVRPFVTAAQIETCISEAKESGATILAIPAFDTLKTVSSKNEITKTMDRSTIWMAQTPQAFDYNLILECHEYALKKKYLGTDDASLAEFKGEKVTVIPGSRHNIKITTKEDYALAKALLKIASS